MLRYITRGITADLPSLPKELLPDSAISKLYNEVCKPIVSRNLDNYAFDLISLTFFFTLMFLENLSI